MRITRVMYYCTCTNGPKTPVRILSFSTEEAARTEAQKLLAHRCAVALGKFYEFKEDFEQEDAWRVDLHDPAAYEVLSLEEQNPH
jgi:hypothetical protein